MSQARTAIYTAIFGGYDVLREPKVIPSSCDFICFTDKKQDVPIWQMREVAAPHDDPTRNARMYKILPHRFLGGYEYSVWIDGNMLVRGDVNELIDTYLKDARVAAYDHRYARHRDREESPDSRSCIYKEADFLLELAKRGRVKDDPKLIKTQVERYRKEGYPADHGMLLSTVFLRRHNDPDVVCTMERWWDELKRGSKRDQMSFNYAVWKENLRVAYIKENVRNNKYFLHMPHKHHMKTWKKLLS